MVTEQTPASTSVEDATPFERAATEGMEEIILDSWLKVFDAKLAAFDVRQDAFFRKFGIEAADQDEAPKPPTSAELALGR